MCLSVEDRRRGEGHAHQSGGADALSSRDDEVEVAVGAVLPSLGPVDLATHANPSERGDGDVTGVGGLVAVGRAHASAVGGDVHVEQVAVPFRVAVGREPTQVVSAVLDVAQSLEPEEVGLVRSAAGAVGAPHGAAEAADQGVVEVQVDRHVEADVPHGRATEGVAGGGELPLELHAADHSAVDGEAAGAQLGDRARLSRLLRAESATSDAGILDVGGQYGVGTLSRLGLEPVAFLALLALVDDGLGQEVVGGEQVVHEAVAGLVGGLDVVDSVTELDVAFQPLLGLTLDDRRGDLRGFGLAGGLGGAGVDSLLGLGRFGLLGDDVLGVLPCHDLHDLEVAVGGNHLGRALVGVAPDVVVGGRFLDAEVALHEVDFALRGRGAAVELEHEAVVGVDATLVLVGLEPGNGRGLHGPGAEAGREREIGTRAVVVDPVADHLGQLGGLGRLGVVAVVVLGLHPDVEVIEHGVAVHIHGRHEGAVPVRVDRGGVGAGSERAHAQTHQDQRQDQGGVLHHGLLQ